MKHGAERLARKTTTVLAIAILWYAISRFNGWLFPFFEHTLRANWIFLPAAFRPLIILMFGKRGAAGLILGAFLTVHGTTPGGLPDELAFSAVLGLTPWFAVSLGTRLLDIPPSLAGLTPKHILVLCGLCAGLNALTLNGYLWASGHLSGGAMQIATVLVGDLVGAVILLLLVSNILAFAIPRPR
jgi:hypothetical protein